MSCFRMASNLSSCHSLPHTRTCACWRACTGTQPANRADLFHRHLATDCSLWIISRKRDLKQERERWSRSDCGKELYFMVGLSMQMPACILHFIFMPLFPLILLYWCTRWRQREAKAAQTPLIVLIKCALHHDGVAYSALLGTWETGQNNGQSSGFHSLSH